MRGAMLANEIFPYHVDLAAASSPPDWQLESLFPALIGYTSAPCVRARKMVPVKKDRISVTNP